ncbi:hypothetical protein, partial [Mixta calida]|uniref:hypothetical protein n=1 Tax=Mixta calida TaxID=665913 RepID=UPI0031454097
VEHDLAKVGVASSSLVSRSKFHYHIVIIHSGNARQTRRRRIKPNQFKQTYPQAAILSRCA